MSKYKQTREDLENHLKEQIAFLQSSADAFDGGRDIEAKRIAATLRTLLHDTGASKSVLAQLGLKTTLFVDSAEPITPDSVVGHQGLVIYELCMNAPARAIAPLDLPNSAPEPRIAFPVWWDAPVFVDPKKRQLSRKALVLAMANQDGGSHVDPVLDSTYADLSRNNSMSWVAFNGIESRPLGGLERIAVRQICHEVLKTLVPGYTKATQGRPDAIGFGSLSVVDITEEVAEQRKVAQARASVIHLSRNAPCPCGGGRKYKYCCGMLDV